MHLELKESNVIVWYQDSKICNLVITISLEKKMDKKISKLKKTAEKEVKGLKSLEKADKKRDKLVEKGKKMKKKGC